MVDEMKKLGICVRYDCNNYGSMLQIYATQRIVKNAGWDYEHIRYDKKTVGFMIKNVTRLFNPYFMSGKIMNLKKAMRASKYPEVKQGDAKRKQLFGTFRKEYIGPYSDVYKGEKNLVKGTDKYDAVMVGSDQLWTPAGIKSRFYNLLFVPDKIKKISLATSFGVTRIPRNQIKTTQEYLNRIEHLSVREISGAKIVKKLTGRTAKVVLDPTLWLTKEEWDEAFPPKRLEEGKYIFAYFLGTNTAHRKTAEEFAKSRNLPIVTCPHLDDFVKEDLEFGNHKRFDVGPAEFLNLIRGAEYVITDSFHGTVFSILNRRPFVTFGRYAEGAHSRNSRIESLLKQLDIESRYSKPELGRVEKLIDTEIDFDKVERRLAKLRQNAYGFIENALNIDVKTRI